MRSNSSLGWALGSALVLGGCSPAAVAVDGGVDARTFDVGPTRDAARADAVTVDADVLGLATSLCDALADDYGAFRVNCAMGDPRAVDLYAGEYWCTGVADLAEEIARGWVVLDRAALDACHARWRDLGACDEAASVLGFIAGQVPVERCEGAVIGQQGMDEPCRAARDCVAGFDCVHDSYCLGICWPLQREGGPCGGPNARCQPELVCREGLCRAPPAVGDPCDEASSAECASSGGWCDVDASVCRAVTLVGEDEACGGAVHCAGDFQCVAFADGTSRCNGRNAVGARCFLDYASTCDDYVYCVWDGSGSIPREGLCTLPASLGEACDTCDHCRTGVPCQAGLRCIEGVCLASGTLGERCLSSGYTPNSDCEPDLFCTLGVCREKRYFGEGCDDGVGACVAGECIGGRCGARLDAGEPCTGSRDCRAASCEDGVCVDSGSCIAG